MEWLTSPEIWIAFFTLTALEIVLGIDNIIMISILVGRMPKHLQPRTRFFGLALAMVTRILLLLSITWVMRLTADLFHLFGQGISGRDLILFFGGLFLLWKSSSEIYQGLEGEEGALNPGVKAETCPACQASLKIVSMEKDPFVDAFADDLATLALDMLVDEAGFHRAGRNLFLFTP